MEPKRKRLRAAATHATQAAAAFSTAAHLVLTHTQPAIASLAHVAQSISACLDWSTKWTLETASKTEHLLLLDRLAAREWPGVGPDFREARFLYNIRTAARDGNVAVLNWWRTKYLPDGPDVTAAILHLAAYTDHLHVIQWLYEVDGQAQSLERMARPLDLALPAIVHWIYEHETQVQMEICLEDAAYQGDLAFINWVQDQSYSYILTQRTIDAAAASGHLSVMQHLIRHLPDVVMANACRNACANGHLEIVKWISKNYCVDMTSIPIMDAVIENDHIHVVKWLVEQYDWPEEGTKGEWVSQAMKRTACLAKMKTLQYLFAHRENPEYGMHILGDGVASGNLEIAKWLHDRNCKSACDLISLAAKHGSFEMLQWVHENCVGVIVSTDALDVAARHSLDMVQFLHEKRSYGCTTNAMDNAAMSGHLDIVMFLNENRSEGCTSAAMSSAAAIGDLELVKYLHQVCSVQCTVEAMTGAAANGHLDVIQYLHKHIPEASTSQAMRAATTNGRIDAVKWLCEHGSIGFDQVNAAYADAIRKGFLDVVAYLAFHCGGSYASIDVGKAMKCGHFHVIEWLRRDGSDPVIIEPERDMTQLRFLLSPEYTPSLDEV